MSLTKKNSNNPLYVVTNDGKDVEQAKSLVDAFVKRFGLGPVLEFLDMMLELVVSYANNYAAFLVVKEFVDQLVETLETAKEKLAPFSSFISL